MALNQIGFGGAEGVTAPGMHRNIISGVGATRTLLAKESGSLCLLDAAAGNVYTLPAPVVGMQFEFQQTVTVTSNAAKVITNSASVFLLGTVQMVIAASATTLDAAANGTTHVAISSNGTTTGGVIGSRFRVTAISSTQWVIDGSVNGSGSIATPFATS
jgi:hypothetical protein